MKYTVIWKPSALQKLAQIWLSARNRDDVSHAVSDIEGWALENDPITKLVRRVRACAREHEYQSDRYHAASIDKEGQAAHVTRLRALDSMNEQLGNMNEALGEILRQPKEALGANPEWQRLKRSLP